MGEADPVLAKAKTWRSAYAEHLRWVKEQGRLETALVQRIGFPGIDVEVPGKPTPAFVQDVETLHLLLGKGAASKAAERELKAALKTWKDEAARCGYSDAKKREKLTGQAAENYAADVLRTKARSLAGVLAKLDVLLELDAPGPAVGEQPWPALRLLRADLQRIAKEK